MHIYIYMFQGSRPPPSPPRKVSFPPTPPVGCDMKLTLLQPSSMCAVSYVFPPTPLWAVGKEINS